MYVIRASEISLRIRKSRKVSNKKKEEIEMIMAHKQKYEKKIQKIRDQIVVGTNNRTK